jgi:hypothetical protein
MFSSKVGSESPASPPGMLTKKMSIWGINTNTQHAAITQPVIIAVKEKVSGPRSAKLKDVFMIEGNSFIPKNWFIPTRYSIDVKQPHIIREYYLNIYEKIFISFERPKSSKVSFLISLFVNSIILIGTVCYVLANDPAYHVEIDHCHHPVCEKGSTGDYSYCPYHDVCPPDHPHVLLEIENAILFIFTGEYLGRVLTLWSVEPRMANLIPEDHDKFEYEMHLQEPDPEMTQFEKYFHYITEWKNVVDLATIIPFYIFIDEDEHSSSFNFIRILRLSRVLHVFKLTKDNEMLHLLERTVRLSLPALSLWFFVAGLGMVLFGSIIFFCEGGHFLATEEYPHGAFFRKDIYNDHHELTPFISIAVSMYWVISTATNTGYSDMTPTSEGGRVIACIVMILGVLTCAIPIGVIGTNFSHEYEQMLNRHKEKAKKKEDDERKNEILAGAPLGLAAVIAKTDISDSSRIVAAPVNVTEPPIIPIGAASGVNNYDMSTMKSQLESLVTMVEIINSKLSKN